VYVTEAPYVQFSKTISAVTGAITPISDLDSLVN
jgi:hypothetical protein